jgi:hypothetical protein
VINQWSLIAMLAMPGLRDFSLSAKREAGGVSCNEYGVFVGHIPLLKRSPGSWTVRSIAKLNDELTACYRLPVDITSKANALALVANALNRGDRAMAAIAAVQMQFPDPPLIAKGAESFVETTRRAAELHRSGLLKVWDPREHPRTGAPPNAGWFAPISNIEDQSVQVAVDINRGKPPSPPVEGGGRADEDLFGGRLPFQLSPYTNGKTYGVFRTPTGEIPLESGSQGPAADMPSGSLGFDGVTKSHVEGHAAALMWQRGITDATLSINNPEICDSCMSLLPRMLPPGATLRVILPNGMVTEFKGIPR